MSTLSQMLPEKMENKNREGLLNTLYKEKTTKKKPKTLYPASLIQTRYDPINAMLKSTTKSYSTSKIVYSINKIYQKLLMLEIAKHKSKVY